MFDVAIVGSGAAGLACAKAAVFHGLKTLLIETQRDDFGGTCLNEGCIPTKLFLQLSKNGKSWQEAFEQKAEVISKIKRPLLGFLEGKGVEIVWGKATFLDKQKLIVGSREIEAKNIIIATGSSAKTFGDELKGVAAQKIFSESSFGQKILIVGAGYIGIEFASFLRAFGKDVTVIEKEESIIPGFDSHLANRLRVILETKGIKINTGKELSDIDSNSFDKIVLAIGRKSNIEGLGLEKAGLKTDENGWIVTDKTMKSNINNIYACGDVTGKFLLAYTAEYQGDLCIDNICGQRREEDYSGLPICAFSIPQIAKVGMSAKEAETKGIKVKVIKSNFMKFSSAYVYNDSDGFIEIVADDKDKIIGASIISALACELISIFSFAIKNSMSLESLRKCRFIHPTLSEILPDVLRQKV